MNENLRQSFLELLARVAPGEDIDSIDSARSYREQFEIDSMAFLELVAHIHQSFDVDVPESDYARIETLDGALAYLGERAPSAG